MPVSTLLAPAPSMSSWSAICVSLVIALDAALPRDLGLRRRRVRSLHALPPIRSVTRTAAAAPWPCSPSRRRELRHVRQRLREAPGRVLDDAHALDEVLGAERRGEARGAARRQHVIRARDVVADHLRRAGARGTPRPRSSRTGARPWDRRRAARGARARAHWPPEGLLEARRQDERAVVLERARARARGAEARRAGARSRRATRSIRLADGVRSTARAIGSCSDWARRSAATKDGSAPASATTTTSLGPAIMSMPTSPKTLALGERHVDIARADDLVHAADGLGAVGRRRDGLRPADPVGLRHAGDPRGDEHGGIERLVGGRRGEEHDLPDARHARGDHRHQDRGRIGGAAARDVHGDARERPHVLAEERAVVIRHAPGARRTGLVKARDALRGVAERRPPWRRRARARRHRARRRVTRSSSARSDTWSKRSVSSSTAASPLARTAARISATL